MTDRLVSLVSKWRDARQAIFAAGASGSDLSMWTALAKAEQDLMAYARDEMKDG